MSVLGMLNYALRSPAVLAGRLFAPPLDRLVILDDAFPHLFSAFRIAEYNTYLQEFPTAHVYSTGACSRAFGDARPFRRIVADYEARYPEFAGRVSRYHPLHDIRGKLVYTIFLHNVIFFLRAIEKRRLPFAFTLYPGYQLDHAETDAQLRRVFSSPEFRKVIVTQPITEQYLAAKGFCPPGVVEMVYGGVVPADYLVQSARPRRRWGRDKDTIDLCFVGFKYVASDPHKGYDVFIEAAKELARSDDRLRFHIVGTCGPTDYDVRALGDRIRFYGPRPTSFFPEFYANMDIILSPNDLPSSVKGAFNGFPTGCCAEAGLSGVAVFCTDPMNQNVGFKDREDLVLINRKVADIVDVVSHYGSNYDELCRLSERGQQAFRRVFDLSAQMEPRLRVLRRLMKDS